MNYKETEQIVPHGLGRHTSRSRVVALAKGQAVPEGCVETDEPVRGWQFDSHPLLEAKEETRK